MADSIVPDWAAWNAIKVNDSVITCANGHKTEINLGCFSPSAQAATCRVIVASTCSICSASLTIKKKRT